MLAVSTKRFRSPALPRFGALNHLATLKQRQVYRAELARLLALGPHLVVDAGLSVREAVQEISKPIWKA